MDDDEKYGEGYYDGHGEGYDQGYQEGLEDGAGDGSGDDSGSGSGDDSGSDSGDESREWSPGAKALLGKLVYVDCIDLIINAKTFGIATDDPENIDWTMANYNIPDHEKDDFENMYHDTLNECRDEMQDEVEGTSQDDVKRNLCKALQDSVDNYFAGYGW